MVKVTVVPELRSLDYCLLKKKEYEALGRHYHRKNLRTGKRKIISVTKKG